jgi:hypothetical protein
MLPLGTQKNMSGKKHASKNLALNIKQRIFNVPSNINCQLVLVKIQYFNATFITSRIFIEISGQAREPWWPSSLIRTICT